jgi:hypothetical protein
LIQLLLTSIHFKFQVVFISFTSDKLNMGCVFFKGANVKHGFEDPLILASETAFSVNEVQALYQLFVKLSIHAKIHKVLLLFPDTIWLIYSDKLKNGKDQSSVISLK